MGSIVKVTDRTTGSCSGMALPTFEIVVDSDGQRREYRLREWAWQASWTLQVLKVGATGSCDADFEDVAAFPTKEAALAHLEATGTTH